MRCVAGAGLLALVGCNQILGISSTREWDGGIDVDPARPHVSLTWQLATVRATGSGGFEPDPVIAYPAIAPAPRVRIAPLDVAFDASPDQTTYADDGAIAVPRRYFGQPWRLEYTHAGVVREVQWNPDDMVGHLTVPMFGRVDRAAAPMGGGYTVTPSNPPPGYTFPRVFTVGLWTEGVVTTAPSGATLDYDFFNASALSGAKGRPDAAFNDLGFVVDFITSGDGCRVAVGSAQLTSVAQQASTHTAQSVLWDAGRKAIAGTVVLDVVSPLTRLSDALDSLGAPGGYSGTLMFGIGGSASMPGLTSSSSSAQLPVPMMMTLLQCPYTIGIPPLTAQPGALDAFPHLLHLQLINTRTVTGFSDLRLTSGVETVALASQNRFDARVAVALPTHITLTTPTQDVLDLGGAADHLTVPSIAGAFTLAITPEPPGPDTPSDLRVDYYDVVVHRIDAGPPTIERIYTSTAPTLRIDGAVFRTGAEYVLEVRAYKGHPKAASGDFAAIDYPYGAAIVFTRTFKT